ncbi:MULTISPECIES: TrmH family RNA methyltransferase [Bifidobacterium]|jgi:tRNA G18 (ribose-2'-O)-methylase SpoU|uniref:RNA methyltransferase n=1 Tax=Bifidobacterium tibiigranuli TaxID=2172043 RepID=A0A5N6S722_9BIFI|nr:TrmH family RNA methyltransferase [Bifidobacterium tibiigranuli]KAE8129202.1 RNA methyltransferase [Bifidobacterium tibiigranuli]KAE8129440.1 RNA methyltransferase [Bifidobacterium tibiigranuli]MCI1210405.1 RNA methyltransferase [Bifidobacterium tibiigranuli]MCI1222121.1 RNA methyltransferase [Bifidobacterium tibiigranuli]MCI1231811.1 RNA methyltransferase [Bifidobacterium tibiigranuli]
MREPNPITAAAKASGEPVFRQIGVGPWSQEHPDSPRPDDPAIPDFVSGCYDAALLDEGDRRNVLDRYRYWTVEAIRDDLDVRGRHGFEVAVENWTHDFNIGSMVRTANAFAARTVHIVGPHKWNRKGSLMTELYQHVEHHPSIEELVSSWRAQMQREIDAARHNADTADADRSNTDRVNTDHDDVTAQPCEGRVVALDIIPGAVPIESYQFPERCLMLFGAEGPGLSSKALELADDVVYISQFGSVRSINAGAAAAVAMHCWIAQHGRGIQQS